MKDKPFIHLFSCSIGDYLYDINRDMILKIKKETYEALKKTDENEENEQIKRLKKEGYLKSNHVQVSEHPMTPFLESFYSNKLNALTLQVTQNCNLRCEYCIYSGKYNTRTHSAKRMSFDIAKGGIDYLLSHSSRSEGLIVGFYGGEPLLEFDLIKKCVSYIEQLAPERNVLYLITTNATLLDTNKIAYMREHGFEITISFDGPKEIHDKYRRFVNGDKGSYDIVMKNVRYIRDMHYEYFKSNVNFNTVLNPQEGYQCIGDYIKGEDVLNEAIFTASIVNDIGLKLEKQKNSEEFTEEYNYEYFKLLMSKLGKVHEDNVSCIVRNEFSQVLAMRGGKHQSGGKELPEKWHHGGPCIPGKRTVFLNVDGLFFPCEKVCEKAEIAVMGNVWKGINIKKASRILNIEKVMETECRQCWAYRYCNFCIRFAEVEDAKLKENMRNHCVGMKNLVERTFKDYCVLRELGYDFETDCMTGLEKR